MVEQVDRNTKEVITDYWQQVANYWRLKAPDWYNQDIAFHRQIWLSCTDIVNATDYQFNTGTATDEVDINVEQVKQALAKIWFAGGSMVVQGVLYQHQGEYHLQHIEAIARQFRNMWESSYDDVHFFDYVETIIVDACASQQINITCLKAISDIMELKLEDICLLPEDNKSLN